MPGKSLARRPVLGLLALACVLAIVWCGGAQQSQDAIEQAIRQLADDSFGVREKASKVLWEAGRAAEPSLRKALDSNDTEVVRRASVILGRFRHGVYPDTPKPIVDLVDGFRASEPAKRPPIIKKLLDFGAPGYAVVVKLAGAEEALGQRRVLIDHLVAAESRIVRELLSRADLDTLEELLEQMAMLRWHGLSSTTSLKSIQDYVAFLALRGTLDQKIARILATPALANARPMAELLVYLHRARGDLPSAYLAAKKTGDHELEYGCLWEQGKWQELLDAHTSRKNLKYRDVEPLGWQAAFERLAGRAEDLEKTCAEIHRFTESAEGKKSDPYWIAKAFYMNARPQGAIDTYLRANRYSTVFEILKVQHRYQDAFALAEKVKGEGQGNDFLLESMRACTLYEIGEKEKALPLLTRLGNEIDRLTEEEYTYRVHATTLYGLGLKDLALEHAAKALAHPKANPKWLFHGLFGDQGDIAKLWWDSSRALLPKENLLISLKRVRAIIERMHDRTELAKLVAGVAEWISALKERKAEERERCLIALAETCLTATLEKEARRYIEDAVEVQGSASTLIRLGDFLVDRQEWRQAAAIYGQAWDKDELYPLPLYLQGHALIQAGSRQEGERLTKLAQWLPLADLEVRYRMAEALRKRGHAEAARQHADLAARVGEFDDAYTRHAFRDLGNVAQAKCDYLAAATYFDLFTLRCINLDTLMLEESLYLTVPHKIHLLRARGLLAVGKTEDALNEIGACMRILPGHIGTPIALVPAFEKLGRNQAADKLFDQVFAFRKQLCTDFPRWGQAHNELAWLSARCCRRLDDALKHAQRAVELAPTSAGYLDTLAEVHFQLGEQTKAIALMHRCIELDARRDYFRRQLKRFEAGDRFAAVVDD